MLGDFGCVLVLWGSFVRESAIAPGPTDRLRTPREVRRGRDREREWGVCVAEY